MSLDIAIVGMACIFPGAPDLQTFWENIVNGVDAISDMPAHRLESRFYDPTSDATDRIYARRGGFIDAFAELDPAAFGVMPVSATTADPDQMLALLVAERALADAGYRDRERDRERTSVILGRGGYVGPGMMRWVSNVTMTEQLAEAVRDVLPGVSEEQIEKIKQEFRASTGVQGGGSAVGLIPNLSASRVANRFDFGGSAYTVDAACASSLVAVDRACAELTSRESDMVLAGGVHVTDTLAFWSVFSQLGALSRRQEIRPFDRDADGVLIGEGLGMLVLKRHEDALRDGDRVYAVIRGSGVASDGRASSLMSPRVDGQVLALQRAWGAVGIEPARLGLVEGHGTATRAGDAAEIATLRQVFGPAVPREARAGLGSVKSMIGHAMPAAGAAGLIKAALAAYHGILPPTLHADSPIDGLEDTRFRLISEAEDWKATDRVAAVNAFGFGGINAHVILEAGGARPSLGRTRGRAQGASGHTRALVLAASTQEGLIEALRSGGSGRTGGWRVAILNPTPERIDAAIKAVESGKERFGRDGILFSPAGVLAGGGKIATLFPGVEAQFDPRIDEVARTFGLTAPVLEGAGRLDRQGLGVFNVNLLYDQVLTKLGVTPDVVAGHSIGEWSGMVASGILDRDEVQRFMETTLLSITLSVPDVAYLAAGTSAERAAALLNGFDSLAISHDNCDHQSILCGKDEQIEAAAGVLRGAGVICEVLPFKSGFHSSAFEPYVADYRKNIRLLEINRPRVPLWSATTCSPYPVDADAVRDLFVEHLVKPVRFRELMLKLYDEGVRGFVQVGTGRLTSFVDDTLLGRRHVAVSLAGSGVDGMDQLVRAAAELFVAGADIRLEALGDRIVSRERPKVRLDLSTPFVHLQTKLAPNQTSVPAAAPTAPPGTGALLGEFEAGLSELLATQDDVARALAQPLVAPNRTRETASGSAAPSAATPALPKVTRLHKRISVQEYPELMGHCLIPQAPNWPHLVDLRPTAPMTMLWELMAEAALEVAPGNVAVRIENVSANTWMHVEPAVELEIVVEAVGPDEFKVSLGEYASGTVVVAPAYPPAPAASTEPILAEGPVGIDVSKTYTERWLFHGPEYQGLHSYGAMGENGIRGTLKSLAASGGLLDSAGQLYGLWMAIRFPTDRIAMPLRIRSVEFFDASPPPGEILDCRVWIRQAGSRLVKADLELSRGGRLYVRILGWDDWRFETGGRLYPVYRFPERSLLAEPNRKGFVYLRNPGWLTTTLDFLGKRFLNANERAVASDILSSRRYPEWLLGRIAAKDAVRDLLFEDGIDEMFPAEVHIDADELGRPLVRTGTGRDLRVSLAHKGDVAVALAAEGMSPGIDIETIEERSESFIALAFNPEEIALLPVEDRDAWVARFWTAKEAVGKALGVGMSGNPKSLRVQEVAGERLLVDDRWVDTTVINKTVVAWTRI